MVGEKKFSPSSFGAVVGSEIPGWKKIRIWDTGSGINIPVPQHCTRLSEEK